MMLKDVMLSKKMNRGDAGMRNDRYDHKANMNDTEAKICV